MSYFYRDDEKEGWNRHDIDVDGDPFGPYPTGVMREEGYSKKPVRSDKHGSVSHHVDCTWNGIEISSCMCFELYTRDYEDKQEQDAEEMHQEWWQ